MKNGILLVALAMVIVLLAGCQAVRTSYTCKATVAPSKKKDVSETWYDVEIELNKIRTSRAGRSEYCIANPRLACLAGELAKMEISDGEKKESGFYASVFVPEFDAGGTAYCFIHFKEKGKTRFRSDFRLTLPQKQDDADI